jgi:16S rRNA (cytosine1402-N4)-methyltransferase
VNHVPVLLKEVIKVLNPQPGEFFIDGTIGSGGHSAAILERISPGGVLLGIDWDKKVIGMMREKIAANSKFKIQNSKLILVQGNYAELPEILKKLHKADPSTPLRASGLILDLGFSSEQLESGRGFSFLKDEPLDMRYNISEMRNEKGERRDLTAAEAINGFSEKDLADIFYKYGEEKFSRRIAKKIVEERRKKPIKSAFDLVNIIISCQKSRAKSQKFKRRIHPATRVFQALRIYVNDELGNLEKALKNIDKIVKSPSDKNIRMGAFGLSPCGRSPEGRPKPKAEARYSDAKGRVAIISYHSLEDRLVKNAFKDWERKKTAKILTKKPIRPTAQEIQDNPRSRSAKLRALILDSKY